MAPITRQPGPKHTASLPPYLVNINEIYFNAPIHELPAVLFTFPTHWPFPRGDLYHWVKLLNRFDTLLAEFISRYELNKGPQKKPFGREMLVEHTANWLHATQSPVMLGVMAADGPAKAAAAEKFLHSDGASWSGAREPDADRLVIEAILNFSRLLLEKCGNRSLYGSSERCNDLINTTNISLLQVTLRLGMHLSQRYFLRQRAQTANAFQTSLLLQHYNVDLEKVQKIANPFPIPKASAGKDKRAEGPKLNANDAMQLFSKDLNDSKDWDEWGGVQLTYFIHDADRSGASAASSKPQQQLSQPGQSAPGSAGGVRSLPYVESDPQMPVTPSPLSRSRNARNSLGGNSATTTPGNAGTQDSPASGVATPQSAQRGTTAVTPGNQQREQQQPQQQQQNEDERPMRTLEIPAEEIKNASSLEDLFAKYEECVPADMRYELLSRLRVAKALVTSKKTRRDIYEVRILAITNLAYVFPENVFQSRIFFLDADEPKRLQLTYQLAEVMHLGITGDLEVEAPYATTACNALEAFAKHNRLRSPDVCAALNVNVGHGILFFVLSKVIDEIGNNDNCWEFETGDLESRHVADDYRDGVLNLLRILPSTGTRVAESLMQAGLMQRFVEIFNLRTPKARRVHSRILEYVDTMGNTLREAPQTFLQANGFTAIGKLIADETVDAYDRYDNGRGLSEQLKSKVIDYQIPYFHQQNLRWSLKFMNHVIQHPGAGLDRVIRNFIDSPPLLNALKVIIENPTVWGAQIWSHAIGIMSNFLNNEPTSYQVIAEAGLSQSFLGSVMGRPFALSEEALASTTSTDTASDQFETRPGFVPSKKMPRNPDDIKKMLVGEKRGGQKPASGILPSSEAMVAIPGVFSAICLNTSGLRLFQQSDALESFFEIFESPYHVSVLKNDKALLRMLGSMFDEFARHQPALKPSICAAVELMIARVGQKCREMAREGRGARLWTYDEKGNVVPAGGRFAMADEFPPRGSEMTVFEESVMDITRQRVPTPRVSSEDWKNEKDTDEHDHSVADYIFCAVKFLKSYFVNHAVCGQFMDDGATEFVLDLATLAALPTDFHTNPASVQLAQVVHLMCDIAPHLVLPSLIRRTQKAVDALKPFWGANGRAPDGTEGFFHPLLAINENQERIVTEQEEVNMCRATFYVKQLVSVSTLTDILHQCFVSPYYTTRSHTPSPFHTVNLADQYEKLVKSLGMLHSACVWEEILLMKALPESWKEATKAAAEGLMPEELVQPQDPPQNQQQGQQGQNETQSGAQEQGASGTETGAQPTVSTEAETAQQPSQTPPLVPPPAPRLRPVRRGTPTPVAPPPPGQRPGSARGNEATNQQAQFLNVKTLRYLLGNVPISITSFMRGLGNGLVIKKRLDSYTRQKATVVADAIAWGYIQELMFQTPFKGDLSEERDKCMYLIVILSSLQLLIFDTTSEQPRNHALIVILDSFKRLGGFKVMRDLADMFMKDLTGLTAKLEGDRSDRNSLARLAAVYGGIKVVITFFSMAVNSSVIVESVQARSMAAQERDQRSPEFFNPSQFLVELRYEILLKAIDLWHSKFAELANTSVMSSLVTTLEFGLSNSEQEQRAVKRSSQLPPKERASSKKFTLDPNRLQQLKDMGFSEDLAREALYRCKNDDHASQKYCEAQFWAKVPPRVPVDLEDIALSTEREPPIENPFGDAGSRQGFDPFPALFTSAGEDFDPSRRLVGGIIDALRGDAHAPGDDSPPIEGDLPSATENQPETQQQPAQAQVITLEDLNELRARLRTDLVERALDVVTHHRDLTFEVGFLINAVKEFVEDKQAFPKEIVQSLIPALVSLQSDEDIKKSGPKIAAYANLLGILLQNQDMYNSAVDDLKDAFESLVEFIKIPPGADAPVTDATHGYIGQVLMIFEKVLSGDEKPPNIKPVKANQDLTLPSNFYEEQPAGPIIPLDDKVKLFTAVMDILPRIGKNESLALSATRMLVILTRQRNISLRLAERKNLQRLFVMMKQVAAASNKKLQASFMIVLRHVIEDEDVIRRIIRNDITKFLSARATHQCEPTALLRSLSYAVIRSPENFLDMAGETVKIINYAPQQARYMLGLKEENEGEKTAPEAEQDAPVQSPQKTTEPQIPSTAIPKEKGKLAELKTPVVEHPDGVIHYLLSELLSYKDVEDKDPSTAAPEKGAEAAKETKEPQPSYPTTTLISRPVPREQHQQRNQQQSQQQSGQQAQAPAGSADAKATKQQQFKAEDHPIYIYRCFLLQCLSELLSSYTRTKVEFINFSRKADPLAATPSKPRSGILNYLLNALLPVDTNEREDSVPYKIRANTSTCAIRVITSLCERTSEHRSEKNSPDTEKEDLESGLTFVRKFVLEHALRAFKDAQASTGSLDSKYARLVAFADLFDKLLSPPESGNLQTDYSSDEIAKMMFEKNFVGGFTSAIADIDIEYPAAKRAVKAILRPMHKLTTTAIYLSESGSIRAPPFAAPSDESDEISSATSVSSFDDDREETPDLFRHSTLGMFEPHQEEDTSEEGSGEDEDEMYDDEEYDDGMDYDEEELEENDGEVVSDEDEDDERGPVEGLPGDFPMDVEVLLDEDENGDDEDDEDDEDEDDEGDTDYGDEEFAAGEITGDNDNDSLNGGDEDEWESEGMSDDGADEDMLDQFENDIEDITRGDNDHHQHSRYHNLLRALETGGQDVDNLDSEVGFQREQGDEDMDEEGEDMIDEVFDDMEDEEGDDEEDYDDEQLGYEDYDEAGSHGLLDNIGLDPPLPTFGRPGHTHRHGGFSLSTFPPISNGMRSHGTGTTSSNAGGRNHLLEPPHNAASVPAARRPNTDAFSDWVHAVDAGNTSQVMSVDSPVTFLNAIIQAISQSGHGVGVVNRADGISIHVDPDNMPPRIQQLFGMPPPRNPPSQPKNDPAAAITFAISSTAARWSEEASILFEQTSEAALRLTGSLQRVLVPPAVEEAKERRRVIEEEAQRRMERERQEREEREKEEAEKEKKRKEQEEEERRQREEQERVAAEERARNAEVFTEELMEGVQATGEVQREAEPAAQPAPRERVFTTIRGRRIDITDLEIDPEYLEALPEDLREEVILQQVTEQRHQRTAAGEAPSEINPEFLEALPPDIRSEILQQEAADRRRRQREQARREAAASGSTSLPEDLDPASFIASLDPSLRHTVLAEQPEEVLQSLGEDILNEARTLTGNRVPSYNEVRSQVEREHTRRAERPRETAKEEKPQRRQYVQMLDRAGVCTLFRLMYMPLTGKTRNLVHETLTNVCANRVNRFEVLSILLLILREASSGVTSLEKSYNQLSQRAKSTSFSSKNPQQGKRFTLPSSNVVTPLLVIQQCLSVLSYLTSYCAHTAWFFLTEHDVFSSLKIKAKGKGKGKDAPGHEFAINALLSLLEKTTIMESPTCMEQLASILSAITQPLTMLARKEREKQEAEAKEKEEKEKKETEKAAVPSIEAPEAQPSGQAQQTTEDTEMTDAGADKPTEGEAKEHKEEKHKKQRLPAPPHVPEHNLRLVVHILSAHECNGRTFRDTLSTINNLSSIPGAKEIIGRELLSQSKALSQSLLVDLAEFQPHVTQARSGTDIHGLALSKFSPASSDQAKLLRVLTALDYLFDPSRAENKKKEGQVDFGDEVLKVLYESPELTPLWAKLSDCLSAIKDKEGMLNVATILLPLIESLMVVCKNTTLKDTPFTRAYRENSVSTPPPEAGLEGLFFKFTEDHRKILNELVRANPKLMSGTFSLLVRNPKVLEFDNKRNYFSRRLHYRGDVRHAHQPLQFTVRRDQVFHDSFRSLYYKSPEELKYGKLNIKFANEEGVDAGGVQREWFHVLARSMFNPDYALFIPVASDRTTFHPNRLSGINQEHLMFFKFIGRIIAKAIFEGRVLDCHFSRAVYKRILGKQVSIKDMETLDLDYYKSLMWMLQNDITDIITETFSVESDRFGEVQIIDLIPNGRNIPVTQENKEEYVHKVVNYRLVGSVEEQLDNFLKGFHDIIPAELISIFNEQELELLISGLPEIDVDDWKANTDYNNYTASSPTVQWFWRAVRSFDKEERAKLLQFVTGTSKVPLNGFKELEGINGFQRFNIHRDFGHKDRLPTSHTCFNQLDLPLYDSYEILRQRLYTAMTTGSGYFGFA